MKKIPKWLAVNLDESKIVDQDDSEYTVQEVIDLMHANPEKIPGTLMLIRLIDQFGGDYEGLKAYYKGS